jgi:hypothetical protein
MSTPLGVFMVGVQCLLALETHGEERRADLAATLQK